MYGIEVRNRQKDSFQLYIGVVLQSVLAKYEGIIMIRRVFNELSQFCFTYVDGNEGWFVGDKYTALFKFDISDCSIKKIVKIAEEELIQDRRYWKLVKIHNKIILIPCKHNKIGILNTDNHNFRYIYVNDNFSECTSYIVNNGWIYLIGDSGIFILDSDLEKVIECIPIPDSVKPLSAVAIFKEGHILVPLAQEAKILDFNISDKSFFVVDLACKIKGFMAGVLEGSDIWLAGCDGDIVRWNYESKKEIIYNKFPNDFKTFDYDIDGSYMGWNKGWGKGICNKYWPDSFVVDDKIWFIPFLSDCLLYIDKRENMIQRYVFEKEEETKESFEAHSFVKFLFIGIYDDRYIKIFSVKRDIIYSIDVKTLEYTEEIFDISEIDIEKMINEFYREVLKKGIFENRNIRIEDVFYLDGIKKMDENRIHSLIGRQIYQQI